MWGAILIDYYALYLIIIGYAAITCCNNNLPIPTSFSHPQSSPQLLQEDGAELTRSGKVKGGSKVAKVFPEDALLDLVRLLHINSNNKIFLAREFIEFWKKKSGGWYTLYTVQFIQRESTNKENVGEVKALGMVGGWKDVRRKMGNGRRKIKVWEAEGGEDENRKFEGWAVESQIDYGA